MKQLFEIFGGRKLLLSVVILVVGLVLQCSGKFDANISMFLLGILGAFSATNVISDFSNRGDPQ